MLLEEIDRLADELKRPPMQQDMDEHGNYNSSIYHRRFGGWNTAVKEAGHQPEKEHKILTDDLLAELRRLHDELDHVPTQREMTKHGKYDISTYHRQFGGWNDAVKEAGYQPEYERDIPVGDLLEEIHRIHDELGRIPTQRDMMDFGKYSAEPYKNRLDGWTNAVKEAGYQPEYERDIPINDLLKEIHRLHDELGRIPRYMDMVQHGNYSGKPYKIQFDGWTNALKEAGYEPDYERNIPIADLLAEIDKLHDKLGRVPMQQDMLHLGDYSATTYQNRFGTWNDALKQAGYEPYTAPWSGNIYHLILSHLGSWESNREAVRDSVDICLIEECDRPPEHIHHHPAILSGGCNALDLLVPMCASHHIKFEAYMDRIVPRTIEKLCTEFAADD